MSLTPINFTPDILLIIVFLGSVASIFLIRELPITKSGADTEVSSVPGVGCTDGGCVVAEIVCKDLFSHFKLSFSLGSSSLDTLS